MSNCWWRCSHSKGWHTVHLRFPNEGKFCFVLWSALVSLFRRQYLRKMLRPNFQKAFKEINSGILSHDKNLANDQLLWIYPLAFTTRYKCLLKWLHNLSFKEAFAMPFTTVSEKILCEDLLPMFPCPSSPFNVPMSISYYKVLVHCISVFTSFSLKILIVCAIF